MRVFPSIPSKLIRRLQAAILEPEMKQQMEIEDGILGELEDMQRQIVPIETIMQATGLSQEEVEGI